MIVGTVVKLTIPGGIWILWNSQDKDIEIEIFLPQEQCITMWVTHWQEMCSTFIAVYASQH